MGQVHKDYWSTDSFIEAPITKVMRNCVTYGTVSSLKLICGQ